MIILEGENRYIQLQILMIMKTLQQCRIDRRKRFFINLALHVLTLTTALVTLHEVDKVRHKIKHLERRK